MTEFEICQMYRQAKDKAMQIEIIANLNLVPMHDVRCFLRKRGYKVPEHGKMSYKLSKSQQEEAARLRRKGLVKRDIAKALSVREGCIESFLEKYEDEYGILCTKGRETAVALFEGSI